MYMQGNVEARTAVRNIDADRNMNKNGEYSNVVSTEVSTLGEIEL